MSEGKVSIEKRGHVMAIGLDRAAKRNAFDLAMFESLGHAYAELERDPEMRVAVLFGHGDHFTGGLDLAQWAPVMATGKFPIPEGAIDPMSLWGPFRTKPVVCAVSGICFTIGIELLFATDLRVAAQGTRFGQIEIKRGIYPVGGATIRMPRECGWGNAMRWLLTGDEFGAEEALRIGMVQEVVPHGEHVARALALADTIAAQAPLGVYATLASSRLALAKAERVAADRLLPDLSPVLASDDAKEGVASFLERRAGSFRGK